MCHVKASVFKKQVCLPPSMHHSADWETKGVKEPQMEGKRSLTHYRREIAYWQEDLHETGP